MLELSKCSVLTINVVAHKLYISIIISKWSELTISSKQYVASYDYQLNVKYRNNTFAEKST